MSHNEGCPQCNRPFNRCTCTYRLNAFAPPVHIPGWDSERAEKGADLDTRHLLDLWRVTLIGYEDRDMVDVPKGLILTTLGALAAKGGAEVA